MSEPRTNGTDDPRPQPLSRELGQPARGDFDAVDPGLVTPGDLGSASRSCLAIIVVLIVILLLLCVFFIGQQVT